MSNIRELQVPPKKYPFNKKGKHNVKEELNNQPSLHTTIIWLLCIHGST